MPVHSVNSENRINWGEWEDWGPCSTSCETGWTTRHRPCIDTVTGDTMTSSQCFGHDVEYRSCTLQPCPSKLIRLFNSSIVFRLLDAINRSKFKQSQIAK